MREWVHRFTAAVIGPGLGREEETERFLARLLGIGEARAARNSASAAHRVRRARPDSAGDPCRS